MSDMIGTDRVVVWMQQDGKGTPFVPFAVGSKAAGMTGKSIPGSSTTPVYSRDRSGKPLLVKQNIDAPSGTPSATLSVYERGQMDVLRKALERGCKISVQSRITDCGSLVEPGAWSALDHWSGGIIGDYTLGDAPTLGFSGTEVSNQATVNFDNVIRLVQVSLAQLTIAETEDLLDIAGLSDEQCNACGNGYPGADKILVIGAAAAAGESAGVWFSLNGGGTWAEIAAKPFNADEDISEIEIFLVGKRQLRIVAATDTTDAAAPAKFAYTTVNLNGIAAATWTVVSMASGANGDTVTALEQLTHGRGYIASAGDIFVTTNRATGDPGAAIYTGVNAIAGFAISPDESAVYAFGANNTLLAESNGSGTFVAKAGPNNGSITAVAVADDGTIFAGAGTKLYKSEEGAETAAGWTELKEFPANYSIVKVAPIKGVSDLLLVYTTESGGNAGRLWQSIDGGLNFDEIANVPNTGFAAAYVSDTDANKSFAVGAGGVVMVAKPAN